MKALHQVALLAGALGLVLSSLAGAERRVAIVLDTSSSMTGNDPQRYSIQISKIVSDLLESSDEMTVIRMPPGGGCDDGPSSSLALRLDPAARSEFKTSRVDSITYRDGTHFAAPIRTAVEVLGNGDSERLLLVVADHQGGCKRQLTPDLRKLSDSGATLAAIHLGSGNGAFESNRNFNFTARARDSGELIKAVALVYQKFLGARSIQTGRAAGLIEVDIAPFLKSAFLVVAADGPIVELAEGRGNPTAHSIDLDHHGGGITRGLDGEERAYRLARLSRPQSGRWRFRVPGLDSDAGWMLIQDLAIGLRMTSSSRIPLGQAGTLEVELIDESTGQRITDPSVLGDLVIRAKVEGKELLFSDDGIGGDRVAGDGIATATARFDQAGVKEISIHAQGSLIDKREMVVAEVVPLSWSFRVLTPERAELGKPVELAVELVPAEAGTRPEPPTRVNAAIAGEVVELAPIPHEAGAPLLYRSGWRPETPTTVQTRYAAVGGDPVEVATADLEIYGVLRFGPATPIELGAVEGHSSVETKLELGGADVAGSFVVNVVSDYRIQGTALEIESGGRWQRLGEHPVSIQLDTAGPRTWPLRLRTRDCPGGTGEPETFGLTLQPVGSPSSEISIPITVQIVSDSWFECWWQLLALAAALLLIAVIAHGFLSPSRFPARLGFQISNEQDLAEGFFHPIRAQRGTGSGFYRSAQVFLLQDYRLAAHGRGALARFRAHRNQVRVQPMGGQTLWRATVDDEWEKLPTQRESIARFGVTYRDDLGSLFFDLRRG